MWPSRVNQQPTRCCKRNGEVIHLFFCHLRWKTSAEKSPAKQNQIRFLGSQRTRVFSMSSSSGHPSPRGAQSRSISGASSQVPNFKDKGCPGQIHGTQNHSELLVMCSYFKAPTGECQAKTLEPLSIQTRFSCSTKGFKHKRMTCDRFVPRIVDHVPPATRLFSVV